MRSMDIIVKRKTTQTSVKKTKKRPKMLIFVLAVIFVVVGSGFVWLYLRIGETASSLSWSAKNAKSQNEIRTWNPSETSVDRQILGAQSAEGQSIYNDSYSQ